MQQDQQPIKNIRIHKIKALKLDKDAVYIMLCDAKTLDQQDMQYILTWLEEQEIKNVMAVRVEDPTKTIQFIETKRKAGK